MFLNNYIYTPLLKKIKSTNIFIVSFVTLITFTIAGFWHGPSWNFIIFGVWHGFLIVINQIFKLYKFKIPEWIKYISTFICINIGFIFFKYENLIDAFEIIKKILYLNSNFELSKFIKFLTSEIKFSLLFVMSIIIIFLKKNSNYYFDYLEKKVIFFLFVIISFILSIFQMGNYSEFIYFKF
jgi:alginate O-acetyltransferase complex protein AlgI